MRDRIDEVEAAGLAILGVSFDSVKANARFADKNDFPFPLLCDTNKMIGRAYGATRLVGLGPHKRISYVIDPEGHIEHAYPSVSPKTHLDVILADLGR